MSATSSTLAAAPESILRRLEWRVIRRLDGLFQGDYRTLFFGEGVDLAELREYQPGDDIRHIDWNVTARMNSPYVRQFMEDREVTAWFLVDLTRSMTFGPEDRPKESILIDFVTTIARVLTRSGNRVGAILYNNGIEMTIPPGNGRNQVLRITHELLRVAGRQTPAASGSTTHLSTLLDAGLNTFKRRSLVFVLSDFISEPGWEKPLSLLYRRHELISVRLWDPRELDLPNAGLLVVEDVETGEHLYVDLGDAGFRRRFAEASRRRNDALKASIERSGVELFAISTEEDLTSAVVRMATLRKRRRQ
jgi:uncharacterized protein (DUF58 family)